MRGIPLAAALAAMALLSVSLLAVGLTETWGSGATAVEERPSAAEERPSLGDLSAAAGMRFGIDAGAVQGFTERAQGPPDYGTVWVGRWNLDHGWRDTDAALVALREANVTPAVHFWYWGDDIQDACFTDAGCNGKWWVSWDELSRQLAAHLQQTLGGAPVLIILESEFNKHGVHDEELLDQALADKAAYLKQAYPAAQVALGFGNWFPEAWSTFDRAAAASDLVGLQAMAATTRQDQDRVVGLADATVDGAERLRALFGKPVIVQDVAVSSYPEPDALDTQEEAVVRFAESLPDLRAAGVEAVIYRSLLDVPDMPLDNHFAEAERHWGLAWHDTGELKPAGQAWFSAIQQARAAVTAAPSADEALAGRPLP